MQAGGALSDKECLACPSGSKVFTVASPPFSANRYACVTCPDPNMEFSGDSCVCKTGYTLVGVQSVGNQSCILDADLVPVGQAASISFQDIQTSTSGGTTTLALNSVYHTHYYQSAASSCYFFRGTDDLQACQMLGNMCVQHMYAAAKKVGCWAGCGAMRRGGSQVAAADVRRSRARCSTLSWAVAQAPTRAAPTGRTRCRGFATQTRAPNRCSTTWASG